MSLSKFLKFKLSNLTRCKCSVYCPDLKRVKKDNMEIIIKWPINYMVTGLWLESKQYNDEGIDPIPSCCKGKWASRESFDVKINSNSKVIRAKWYNVSLIAKFSNVINTIEGYCEYMYVRDVVGHRTHTSTTTTGSIVHNVSYNGLVMGTVRRVAL